MAIQLEPIELDISDALNDIDTLKEHIEDVFSKHGASDDPRIERLLMQLRDAYDTLNDLQDRMESIHFDPEVESTLTAIRNDINELQAPLQQAREYVASLEQAFQNMNFDPLLDSKIQSLGVGISNLNTQLDECRERMANLTPSEEASQKYSDIQQQIEGVKDRLTEAQDRMRDLSDKLEPDTDWANPQGNAKVYVEEQANIKALQKELQSLYITRNQLIEQNPNLSANSAQMLEQERQRAQALSQQLQELRARREELQNQASVRDSMSENLEQARQVAQSYENELQRLEQEEQALQEQMNNQNLLADEYQRASDNVTILQQRLSQLAPEIEKPNRLLVGMQHLFQSIQSILMGVLSAVRAVFSKIGELARTIADKIKSVLSSLLGHIKSIAKSIGDAIGNKFNKLGKSAQGLGGKLEKGFGKAFKTLLKYGLGVRSLFFLFRKLRSAATASLGEMAKQIPEVNKQMSSLKQSMNQMKGSLGTLIQPILNILVPVLQKVASLVTAVTEKIASFFALLTGQSYIVTATANTVDYAESLDKSGKSAKKAKKELEGYLSPIDEINKYSEKNKDDNTSGGAGGDVQYAKKNISKEMQDLFDWLKKMWEKGDFTELGRKLGEKLLAALQSIPWDKIKENARKLGKSLATLIGGFITVDGLGYEIGKTIAEAFNTAFEFLNSFVHNLPWRALGKFFADALNGIFNNIDWELIYDTVVTGLRGIGEAIWQFITQFRWDNIYDFIKNAIKTIAGGIKALFTAEGYDERGFKQNGTWVQRLAKEIGAQFRQLISDPELMGDIGETIGILIKNVYDFIVNFITEVFSDKEGISEGIRGFIEGILTGIGLSDEEIDSAMSWVDTIGGWLDKLIEWVSGIDWADVWNTVVSTAITVWNTLHDIWVALKPVLSDIWKAMQPILQELGQQLIQFLKDLPGYLEQLRNSEEFKSFLDWLSSLTWDDIKQGLSDLGDALKTLGKIVIGLKGFMIVANGISAIGTAVKGLKGIGKGLSWLSGKTGLTEGVKGLASKIGTSIKSASVQAELSGAGSWMSQVLLGDIGANLSAGGATMGATIGASIVGGIAAFFGGSEIGKKLGGWLYPDDKELYDSYSGILGTLSMVKDFFVALKDFVIMTWDDLCNGSTEKLAKGWEWILRITVPASNALFDVYEDLRNKVIEIWNNIKEKVTDKLSQLKQKFDDFKAKADEFKQSIVDKFNTLKDGINEKIEFIKQKFEDFKNAVSEKWDAVKQKFEDFRIKFVETCTAIKEKVTEFKDKLQEIWENIKEKVNEFTEAVADKFNAFKEKIEEFREGVQKKFEEVKENFIKVFEDIKNGIKEPINGILTFIENFVNKVIDMFNAMGEKVNKLEFDIPDWVPLLGGKELKIGLPELSHISIPKLAQGAVIPPNKEFMATLGDQKSGTNIETPLATMVDAFNQALAMNGGGNQSITLNLMLPDKRTIAQYAIEGGQVLQMSRGRNPFLLERG